MVGVYATNPETRPLVVIDCEVLQKRRSRCTYHVVATTSAQEAVRFCENHTSPAIDLALIDVMMPGMNGIELASRIRNDRPNTKIVLMSGFGPRDVARIAGGNNPYRIIWKPFKAESLLRMIENALGSSAAAAGA
jgi:CheY-like chemotaxis protein